MTGGGQGVGAAISRVLARAGALVAATIKHGLLQPAGTAIAEVVMLPTQETSWP